MSIRSNGDHRKLTMNDILLAFARDGAAAGMSLTEIAREAGVSNVRMSQALYAARRNGEPNVPYFKGYGGKQRADIYFDLAA